MPGQTATQKLTYPTSGDLLKEQALYIETLAKQVDARMASNVATLARQLNRPFALLDATTQRVISTANTASPESAGFIRFDSVVVDTAALIDLTNDDQVITLPTAGYWIIGGYADFVGVPGGSSCASVGSITMTLHCDNSNPSNWAGYVKDHNTGHSYVHVAGLARVTAPTSPGRIYMDANNAGTTCSNGLNVFRARMWAFKAREL